MSALKPSSLSRWDSSLLPWHEWTRSTAPPPQIGCQSNATASPPAFHQASLTIHQYPLILLGGERHGDSKMFCPGTLLNDFVRSQTQTFWPWLLTDYLMSHLVTPINRAVTWLWVSNYQNRAKTVSYQEELECLPEIQFWPAPYCWWQDSGGPLQPGYKHLCLGQYTAENEQQYWFN